MVPQRLEFPREEERVVVPLAPFMGTSSTAMTGGKPKRGRGQDWRHKKHNDVLVIDMWGRRESPYSQ